MADNYNSINNERERESSMVMGQPVLSHTIPLNYEVPVESVTQSRFAGKNCRIAVIVISLLIVVGSLLGWIFLSPSNCVFVVGQYNMIPTGSCYHCEFACTNGTPTTNGNNCTIQYECTPPACCLE